MDSKQFCFIAIYGCNESIERRGLWNHLLSLHNSIFEKPWILSRDFNIIAQSSKSSHVFLMVSYDIREFIDVMLHLSIFDNAFSGPFYTWSNHQPNGFLVRNMDIVLINDNWLSRFANFIVEFLAYEVSDHCPALIQL